LSFSLSDSAINFVLEFKALALDAPPKAEALDSKITKIDAPILSSGDLKI